MLAAQRPPKRTGPPTRRSGGAQGAGTTPSSPRCRCSCRSWEPLGRTRSSCPVSVLVPFPVLHEHLRHPLHPWPSAGGRHRCGGGPPRSPRVGHHRRRRRPVHRRQPPSARPAAATSTSHHPVQQPDLRADPKGQYSPTSETGKITKSTHSAPSTSHTTRCRWRWGQRPVSWPAPTTWTAST